MDQSTLDFAAFESEMDIALNRLDDLFPEPTDKVDGGAVSFDVAAFTEVDAASPEGQLLALMQEAETPEAEKAVSFGIGETVSGAMQKAQAEFDSFMERINRDILNFAHVESGAADSPVAATRINWTGDALTVLSAGATPGDLREHGQTLRRELMSRNLRLRMFSTVTIAAGKISLALTTPGSAILALPMAYQYVSQLSKQWQALQSLNQP
jgi:hypothetical protein